MRKSGFYNAPMKRFKQCSGGIQDLQIFKERSSPK